LVKLVQWLEEPVERSVELLGQPVPLEVWVKVQ
jgi:hypothetical protein